MTELIAVHTAMQVLTLDGLQRHTVYALVGTKEPESEACGRLDEP